MTVAKLELEGTPEIGWVAEAVAAGLQAAPVVHVGGGCFAEDATPFWTGVIERLGRFSVEGEDSAEGVRNRTLWTDIRYDPRFAHTFRHHNAGQPLHTDGAYNQPAADVVMFWCARPAPAGGATLFVDADTVADAAAAASSELFADLASLPVRFRKATGAGRTAPILDMCGHAIRTTWNYYRVDADQGPDVERLKEAFHAWLAERIVAGGLCDAIRLARHEAVFFRDDRVLHGRNAYRAAARDDRLLWKSSFFLDAA